VRPLPHCVGPPPDSTRFARAARGAPAPLAVLRASIARLVLRAGPQPRLPFSAPCGLLPALRAQERSDEHGENPPTRFARAARGAPAPLAVLRAVRPLPAIAHRAQERSDEHGENPPLASLVLRAGPQPRLPVRSAPVSQRGGPGRFMRGPWRTGPTPEAMSQSSTRKRCGRKGSSSSSMRASSARSWPASAHATWWGYQ
jgi:hypothetical protein